MAEMRKAPIYYEEEVSKHSYNQSESFSQFIKRKQKELNELTGTYCFSTQELAKRIDIKYEHFRKIINKQKETHKRDDIISICLLLILDVEDTTHALHLYNMSELNRRFKRDEAIMDILTLNHKRLIEALKNSDTEEFNTLSIEAINENLCHKGFTPLDNHKPKRRISIAEPRPPFEWKKKNIKCCLDNLLFDVNNSLVTTYDPKNLSIEASIFLKEDEQKHTKLIANSNNNLIAIFYPTLDSKTFYSLDETGVYKYWFLELNSIITSKRNEMLSRLNDTRNYRERISARIINNDIHVFYEIYNYDIPELGEYYLMDYADGVYTLYISNKSRFMQYYLTEQEYYELYGKAYIKSKSQYISSQEIENKIKEENTLNRDILEFHLRAYDTIKDKIDSLIDKLKTGKAHIRNLEMIYDENPYEVLRYYKVAAKYECAYDPGFDEIDTPGVDSVLFTLTDGRQVDLSVEDLQNGFRLGLNSIDEIGSFLLEHNTLKIQELL